jgi:hypothetical protein
MEVTRIVKQNYTKASKWTVRSKTSGSFYRLKKHIRNFLEHLSGGEIVEMMKDVLEIHEIKQLDAKAVSALKSISQAVNNRNITKPYHKHHFIRPLRTVGMSLNDAHELGFECGSLEWQNCLDESERKLGGRPCTDRMIIEEINTHMESLSNTASCKTVKIGKYAERISTELHKPKRIDTTYEAVRYRQTTIKEAWKLFIERRQHDKKMKSIPFTTFYKKIDKRFKKPFQLTDLCDYCEMGKNLQKELKAYIRENKLSFNEEYTINNLSMFFNKLNENSPSFDKNNELKLEPILEKIKDLRSIEYHKSIADRQRLSYNKQRKDIDFLEGKILIDIDFKEKIILGKSPRQLNSYFFDNDKKKVICLGIGVHFVDTHIEKSGRSFKFVNCLNIDVISDYDGQKASDVIRIFRYVMQLPEFKQVDQKNYVIWADCGRQFRCAEFNYFLFNELAEKNKLVSLNFFAEKHGKKIF